MILRFFISFLLLFCFSFPTYSEDYFLSVFIDKTKDNGNAARYVKTINDYIIEEINSQGLFIIVTELKNADYLLASATEEKDREIMISIEITGISTRAKLYKKIVNKTKRDDDIGIKVEESLDYIHRVVFPFEVFYRNNMLFFTTRSKENLQGMDIIDRSKEEEAAAERSRNREEIESISSKKLRFGFLDPLNRKLFSELRFQIFPSVELAFPVNLMDDYVYQTSSIHFPVNYYLFTSDIIMVAVQIEGFYFPLYRQISLDIYNTLDVVGAGAGFRVSYPFPFYKRIAFHLSVCGGLEGSFLTSGQYSNDQSFAFNPYIHPVFEIEHVISRNFSISAKFSYILVFYAGEYLHMLQTGGGLGVRF